MYEYFKNIAEKNSCQSLGACSTHPSINALYEILLNQIREISFYLVKLKEFSIVNKIAMAEAIEALSIFLINTSFNKEKYLNLAKRLYYLKTKIKEKYEGYCKDKELPCEIINTNLKIDSNTTISDLIQYAQSKQKSDIAKQRLFELITIMAKIAAINIVKIKKYEADFDNYDFEILRFFALTNGYSIRNEKIIRRIKEFSKTSLEIKEKLYSVLEEKYGKKETTNVSTTAKRGHGILVSGDDLDELEGILKTLEELNPKEEINVYTHGAMFLAHFYPYFKNNKFLKGHLGGDNAQYDFSIFPGAILITQNFIQKIDTLYKGEIFSNKIISFEKMANIISKDYKPLIEASKTLEGYLENEKENSVKISYDIEEIKKTLDNLKEKNVIIIAGKNDEETKEEKDTKIINLNCPIEMDLLINSIKVLKEKGVKITIFFTQCNLESLSAVLSLLNQDIEIYISNCPYILINPHVIEALKLDFKVKII